MIRNIILFFFVVLFSINAFTQVDGSKMENEQRNSMHPIIFDLDSLVTYLEGQNMEIVHIEFDIIEEESNSFRKLYQGWKYGFFVYGDYRIEKIQIEIYQQVENSWKFQACGDQMTNTSIAWLFIENTANYRFQIRAEEFNEAFTTAHYGLIIFH